MLLMLPWILLCWWLKFPLFLHPFFHKCFTNFHSISLPWTKFTIAPQTTISYWVVTSAVNWVAQERLDQKYHSIHMYTVFMKLFSCFIKEARSFFLFTFLINCFLIVKGLLYKSWKKSAKSKWWTWSTIFIFIYTEFYSGLITTYFVSINRIAGFNALTINVHRPWQEEVSSIH